MISSLHGYLSINKKAEINEDLIRHITLNSIRFNIKKFKKDYGNKVIIACDSRKYWRKDIFKHYKANRKKLRENSDLDWNLIFTILNMIKVELKNHFPYFVLEIEGAEADDIIGTLVPRISSHEKVIIVSADGDFAQLQKYPNVQQYSPKDKKFVISSNPAANLKEKIIRGDTGDGIPNILSQEDCFVQGIRQKQLREETMNNLLSMSPDDYQENAKIGYYRNRELIDLDYIPKELKENIISTYDSYIVLGRADLLNYFITHKLKNLLDSIGDF